VPNLLLMINALIIILLFLLLVYLLRSVHSNLKQQKFIEKEEDAVRELENQNSAFL